jgi:hypothetical protein
MLMKSAKALQEMVVIGKTASETVDDRIAIFRSSLRDKMDGQISPPEFGAATKFPGLNVADDRQPITMTSDGVRRKYQENGGEAKRGRFLRIFGVLPCW